MAQLKSLIDELDIINEKLERMNGLLATALEKYADLQICDAELHVHPTPEQGVAWMCLQCNHWNKNAWIACGYCAKPRPERSDVE